MACEEDYIDCTNSSLSVGQLFRKLLAKITVGLEEKPALRVCVSNADAIGGVQVQHFVANAGQTVFNLANPILKSYALFKDGAATQTGHSKTGASQVTTSAGLLAGTEITIIY